MKKILILSLAILCLGSLAWGLYNTTNTPLTRAEQIRADLLNPDCQRVLVAAHRADWRNWPENSLPAIQSAIDMGVDIVEIDLQCTADSQLIVMHDSKINRTTTGKGVVAEMTLDSIMQYKLKNGVNIRTRHQVPTLREVLQLCRGQVLINLDKADRYFDLIVPILEETGTTRQIIMKGRKPAEEVKTLYGKYLDEVIYMPIVDLNDSASIDVFCAHLESRPCAFELCWRAEDQYVQHASALTKGKALLWVNCLWDTLCGGHEDDEAVRNPDDHYGYLIDSLGFGIIQTDRPEFLIQYLQNR